MRQGEVLSREQLQFLTMGGHGELADPERKELIQRVNTLLKVITILLNPVRAPPKKTFSLPVGQVIVCTFHQMIFNFADSLLDLIPSGS